MIVGITSFFGAGKDTVAEYLVKKKAFEHISLSDMVREEVLRRGQKITRERLQNVANELRIKYGSSVLTMKALKKMLPEKNYVITSIRTKAEVEVLKEKKTFVLIFIDAPIEVRFSRIHARRREQDPQTLEDFKRVEGKELRGGEGSQQLIECKKMANITLRNDFTIEALYKKLDRLVLDLKKKFPYKRPSWDDYFMNIAKVIGQRGSCERGRTGCVIVKNNRILATGYVGSPPGLPHCDEIGHLYQKVIHADGKVSQHCIRTIHGEQNAIAVAAKHGISIEGATIYMKLAPCIHCAKLVIAAGIKRVVCEKLYHAGDLSIKMFKEAGIKVNLLKKELEKYENQ
jgi:dCMP deaminase